MFVLRILARECEQAAKGVRAGAYFLSLKMMERALGSAALKVASVLDCCCGREGTVATNKAYGCRCRPPKGRLAQHWLKALE